MASTENMGRDMNKWTAKEVDYLRDNYSFLNTGLIAQFLNRGVSAVQAKASRIADRKEECLQSAKSLDIKIRLLTARDLPDGLIRQPF